MDRLVIKTLLVWIIIRYPVHGFCSADTIHGLIIASKINYVVAKNKMKEKYYLGLWIHFQTNNYTDL